VIASFDRIVKKQNRIDLWTVAYWHKFMNLEWN
jgi:hypothetical protein